MKILVTGGSGSIGSHLCRHLLDLKIPVIEELHVLSNNGHELYLLQKQYPEIIIHNCDILDDLKVNTACEGIDVVIHLAAFKYAPDSEEPENRNPVYTTNVDGTHHIINTALAHDVEVFINLSSDKAVNPKAFYASTKALGAILVKNISQEGYATKFINIICGNVFNSIDSVWQEWTKQLQLNQPLTITDQRMMRYYITMEDICSFIIYAMNYGKNGETLTPPQMVQIETGKLADAFIELSGGKIETKTTGPREGEKLVEELYAPLNDDDIIRFIRKAGL